MTNIISGRYARKLYPVNPFADTILNLKCYRSIPDIEDKVELTIIISPSQVVPYDNFFHNMRLSVILSILHDVGEQAGHRI